MPAVSTITNSVPSTTSVESIVSLVVPDTSLTITLSLPRTAFTIEDLPALGFPIMASFIGGVFFSSTKSGKNSVIISSKSPTPPVPCRADIGYGSPNES